MGRKRKITLREIEFRVKREATNYVYILVDPRTEEICYVGMTEHVEQRYYQHVAHYMHTSNSNMLMWIGRLRDINDAPRMIVIAKLKWDEKTEAKYIRQYWSEGHPLLNRKDSIKASGRLDRLNNARWYKEFEHSDFVLD